MVGKSLNNVLVNGDLLEKNKLCFGLIHHNEIHDKEILFSSPGIDKYRFYDGAN